MQRVFVSRDNELDRMDRLLAQAINGKGQLCFVTGEAGFGKSCLTAEFARRAQQQNTELLVAIGDCNSPTGSGDPYLPFREVLAMLAGDIDDRVAQGMTTEENASRLREFLRVSKRIIMEVGPDLIGIFVPGIGLATKAGVLVAGDATQHKKRRQADAETAVQPHSGWTRDSDQGRIFEQVTRVLVTLASSRPLILILDDLHWVDDSSAGLLFHLGRRIEGSRILIVGTYRPEEVSLGRGQLHHPLAQIVPELKRHYGDIIVELADSDEAEGMRFVNEIVDSEPNKLDRGFRAQLFQRTRGHPLFTTELLRAMYERGALLKDLHGKWIVGPHLDWDQLPARAEGVIEERVNRLPEDLRRILTVASVEGEIFTAQVVAKLLNIDERSLLPTLTQELDRKHRLITEESTDRVGRNRISKFRFRHQLFRKYLYDSLGMSERELLHEDVAACLEQLYEARLEAIAVYVAHHCEQAGIVARAAEYYLRAGRRALRMFASQEAATLAGKGIACLDATEDSDVGLQLELMLLQGDALLRGGKVQEAMETFRLTAERAIALGVAEVAAKAAIGYSEPRWRFNMLDGTSVKLLNAALDLLGDDDNALRACLIANIARSSEGLRPHGELLAMLEEAVAMARRVGDVGVLIDCARFRFSLDRDPAHVTQRLKLADELLARTEQSEHKLMRTELLVFLMNDCAAIGNVERWQSCLDAIETTAAEISDPFHSYNVAAMRVALPLLKGQFDAAERQAMQAFETGRRLGVDNIEGVMGVQMFTVRREQGRLHEVAPMVRHFVAERGANSAWLPGLALIHADLGQLDDARSNFDDLAAGNFAIVARDSLWQTCLCYLAEVCDALGDVERAEVLYKYLLPYRALTVVVGNAAVCLGASARYLGQLAALLGRWVEAEEHLDYALGMDERIGALPWLAHSQFQMARLLQRRGHAEDAERARALVRQACATAESLGMAQLLAVAGKSL